MSETWLDGAVLFLQSTHMNTGTPSVQNKTNLTNKIVLKSVFSFHNKSLFQIIIYFILLSWCQFIHKAFLKSLTDKYLEEKTFRNQFWSLLSPYRLAFLIMQLQPVTYLYFPVIRTHFPCLVLLVSTCSFWTLRVSSLSTRGHQNGSDTAGVLPRLPFGRWGLVFPPPPSALISCRDSAAMPPNPPQHSV